MREGVGMDMDEDLPGAWFYEDDDSITQRVKTLADAHTLLREVTHYPSASTAHVIADKTMSRVLALLAARYPDEPLLVPIADAYKAIGKWFD